MIKRCEYIRKLLPSLVDNPDFGEKRVSSHLQTCLTCQAEMVKYRKLLKLLTELRKQVPSPPSELLIEILDGLEEATKRSALKSLLGRSRVPYLIGITVAVASVGTFLLVATHSRGNRRINLIG